ncbi:MAG TPA: SH3 domain-containing protein [Bryobacteraceae bacterium]|nr:SH3 domain-containing protein [Bryobacteraceae bacterium]
MTLNLRKELGSKSAVIGTARHGDKLDVLEMRRRFIKVRTAEGVVGWTDSNLLLTPQQMDDLRRLADSAAKLPSQGSATAFDALNIHAEPSRQSPSFFQIPESGSVEVIAHRVTPRVTPQPPAPVRRSTASKKAKGKESKRAFALPIPQPPSPPPDWLQLSRPRASDLPGYVPPAERNATGPVDDWSLVRTKDGKVGWVLARMLMMSIPDEVAQYAEGHRITAYISLGDVTEKGESTVKHNWLWTTASTGQLPYEFDSFRVFVWSARRHHYETAYIERNVKGFYPVATEDRPGEEGKGFSLVLQDKDGKLYKRTYAFSGYRVRMVSKTPYVTPPALPEVRASRSFDPVQAAPSTSGGWQQKLREWRTRWTGS